MSHLQEAIKKTFDYALRFGGRLSREQLTNRLLSSRVYKKNEIEKESNLMNLQFDSKTSEMYRQKIIKVRDLADQLQSWPDIFFMGITGSLAAGYPKINEDIDLLLIVKEDRLWFTRLKIKWWLVRNQINHRNYYDRECENAFCLNLWLDEKSLKLPKKRRVLQNAVDMMMMIPILNKNNCFELFLKKNYWVNKYVATGYHYKISKFNRQRDFAKLKISNSKKEKKGSVIYKIINLVCYAGQRIYMIGKVGKGEVGIHKAYFYP